MSACRCGCLVVALSSDSRGQTLALPDLVAAKAGAAVEEHWLKAFLNTYYYLPSLAFWRAIEARELGTELLPSPSLDVGSFDGSFAATWLGARPPIDVGLDINPVSSRYAGRAYRRVVTGDAQAMPFEQGTFNSILCNSVIEHVPDDTKVISEFARVLRPGGILLLTTPSIFFHDFLRGVAVARQRGDEAAAAEYMRCVDRRLSHFHYRSVEEWSELLGRAGLRVVAHSYYLPQSATAWWDQWDTWMIRSQFGRPRWRWVASRKLGRLFPPALWVGVFFRLNRGHYIRALMAQRDPDGVGASIYIRAVRG